ncbi:MAG: site-specific integrase [Polyangiaceae bacterium]|nr:site-specific integrase [Polyangiaceae bacterium]
MGQRLFKRNGTWYGWVFDCEGKRIQRSTKCRDKRAAEIVLREWERRAADPTYAASHATSIEQALKQFLTDRLFKGRAAGTLSSYRVKAGHVVRLFGGDTSLAKVDARAVDRFIETRLGEGASRNTVHKELTVLRATLKVAKRRGEFPRDIDAVMPDGFSAAYTPRTRFLTALDAQKLFAELSPDRAALVAFILATGARWGEAVAARFEDVDQARGLVFLRGTKTEGSLRTVPIVGAGVPLLDHALRHAEGQDGFLFTAWGNVRRDLAVACKHAGIASVTPNDLRRTCATWLRQRDIEPHLIAAVLGHRDSRMVERVYGRLPTASLKYSLETRLGEPAEPCSAFVANTSSPERSQRHKRHPQPPIHWLLSLEGG